MNLPDIRNVDVAGKTVFLRAGLNVPVRNGEVTNDFRIKRALPGIKLLVERGAKLVIAGHLGRDPEESMRPVYEALSKHISVQFCEDVFAVKTKETIKNLKNGEAVLLENMRHYDGEVRNDPEFAKHLASLAELYVNDAFSVSHRLHASVVGVPKYLPAYAGPLVFLEIENLERALAPEHPALAIIAGAKFETKLPLIESALPVYDCICIAGALATDFYKARGYEVGGSTVSDDVSQIYDFLDDEKIKLPHDVVVKNGDIVKTKLATEVLEDDVIVDAGPETVAVLEEMVRKAKFILWNGPLGKYEEGFNDQTNRIAQIISESDAISIVGGGDSVAAISMLGLEDAFTFLSTGGGSMLDYIVDGTLPGLEVLHE